MRDTTSRTGNSTKVAGPMPVKQDRRERSRLRELCDEVLASFRVAQSRELLSEQEIAESRKLLATMTPALFGR